MSEVSLRWTLAVGPCYADRGLHERVPPVSTNQGSLHTTYRVIRIVDFDGREPDRRGCLPKGQRGGSLSLTAKIGRRTTRSDPRRITAATDYYGVPDDRRRVPAAIEVPLFASLGPFGRLPGTESRLPGRTDELGRRASSVVVPPRGYARKPRSGGVRAIARERDPGPPHADMRGTAATAEAFAQGGRDPTIDGDRAKRTRSRRYGGLERSINW
jgi:hypothetical protein